MSGSPEGRGPIAPIGGPVAAANSSGVLSAPAEDDLMGLHSCPIPFLYYGEGFSQSYKADDFESWHIESGNTFSGKFLLAGRHMPYKDIQVRVIHSNAAKTERHYRDFNFSSIPVEGTVFETSVEAVGYGDFVEFYATPREKIPAPETDLGVACLPTSLRDFSEDWAKGEGETPENALVLLARFKVFTPIQKMEGPIRPEIPEIEIDRTRTP